ncbi:hypothetical protein [Gordonia rubripertincta]|uniref:hypothetical protein n=1 Tax=Gordonia rubripertincta TaxID=36822 RepID=UPI0015FB323F|nr:hypothetical protein [Gordonia rubripertincta]QMU22039.1 hypothetical protein H3V45_05990 [Gordonia rubripertincta]
MIRRARGRHRLADGGTPVAAILQPDDDWIAPAIRGNPHVNWLPPQAPVGVFVGGRVHIAPTVFDPPADSPYARMCRHLDDMQPTIRQLTQRD